MSLHVVHGRIELRPGICPVAGDRRRGNAPNGEWFKFSDARVICGQSGDVDSRRFQSYSVPHRNWRSKELGDEMPFWNKDQSGSTIPSLFGSIHHEEIRSAEPKPLRPKRIILVRHGQSEGNVDESAYTRTPDSKISLTDEGWTQAIRCGKKIRELIEKDGADDWQVFFYVSPYQRTLQTLRGIGMAFERQRIAGVREEPRLREQDFGNFQDREKMRVEKAIRLRYGRFFYRFPNGESAADVYDRITGFRETIRADIDVGRFQRPEHQVKNTNLVLVSHGLTLRVFLMRWYKWTVEQFENLWNFGNTGVMVMELGRGGRYCLSIHHTPEELRTFGMTDHMIADQEWQKSACPGELNYDWYTSGASFFTHFDEEDQCSDLENRLPDADCGPPMIGNLHVGSSIQNGLL